MSMAIGWHLFELHGAEQRQIRQRLDGITHLMLPSLKEAADVGDTARLHALLTRLAESDSVAGTTLWGTDGSVERRIGVAVNAPASFPDAGNWQPVETYRWITPLRPAPRSLWLDLTFKDAALGSPQRRARLSLAVALAVGLTLLGLRVIVRRRERTGVSTAPDNSAATGPASGNGARDRKAQALSPATAATPSQRQLAFASHELRAPLSGLLGFCRLLEGSSLNARQREWLRHIDLASRGLLETVDHVLGDTRHHSDEVFDIADLAWEVACLQAPLAQAKRITLLPLVYDEVPPRLLGASLPVRQLLTNLINNAIKHGRAGDVVICVRLERRDSKGVRLRLSVRNEGALCADQHRRLKQRLATAADMPQEVMPDEADRLASGLAICRELVATMDGSVDIETGQGWTTLTACFALRACEPLTRLPEFDLDGARIAVHQPHRRLARLLDHTLKRWSAAPSASLNVDALAAGPERPDLIVVGIERSDLESDAAADWQRRFDEIATPCLLLVNAGPTEALEWRLPPGSRIQRLPMSRYMFGRALTSMLSEHRLATRADRPQVLVIDDDELSQHYLDAMVSIVGARPLIAETFAGGLQIAQQQRIDLVLMDRHLPDACGDEQVATLKGLGERWQQIPIVLMSADLDQKCATQPLIRRPDEQVGKPLNEQRLRQLLARHLPATIAATDVQADTVFEASASHSPDHAPATDSANHWRSDPFESGAARVDTNQLGADALALPVIDPALSLHLAGGRQALADDMLALLWKELPAHRRALENAWTGSDEAALAEAAHKLNGGCRYCGVPALSEACEALERRLNHHGIHACVEEWHALQEALQRTLAHITSQ
ncbi:Hpt domain-containing protein [Salinicola aestuarinus]|uniref:Hpt domain-containing protein n=1 Tax=Salinicola aestuarinus TaxID=1949082 RepID=UPI00165FDA91|nr:Hpt domain-containing protein [Salinicola aestuarinus]